MEAEPTTELSGQARGGAARAVPLFGAGTAIPTPLPVAVPVWSYRRVVVSAVLLGVGMLSLLLLFVPGAIDGIDAQSMMAAARSIVEHGTASVPSNAGVPGIDGRHYSKYGPAQSLAVIPLYLAGRLLQPLVPLLYRPEVPGMAAALLPALLTALATTVLVLLAVEFGATMRGAFMLGAVYALTTPAAVYAVQWFSEPLVSCTLLAAVYLLVRDRARPGLLKPALAGLMLAVAVATRVDAVLYVVPCAVYVLRPAGRRRARMAALLLPIAAVLSALGLYNLLRFGSPLETGYGRTGSNPFDYLDTHPDRRPGAILGALYGLWLSPGKGLAVYAPAVLLAPFGAVALWVTRRAEAALLLTLIAVDTSAHANILIRWVGGWSWGPRFLIPVLPFVILLIAPLLRPLPRARGPHRLTAPTPDRPPVQAVVPAILAVLSVLGFFVQVPALFIHEPHIYIYDLQPIYGAVQPHPLTPRNAPVWIANTLRMERDYIEQPGLSPVTGGWQLLGSPGTWTPATAVVVEPHHVAATSVTVTPNTWWRLLALQGASPLPLTAACLLLLLLAVSCIGSALFITRHQERAPPVELTAVHERTRLARQTPS